MNLIAHILAIAAITVVFLLFFLPERNWTDRFMDEADALRIAIKEGKDFDRRAWDIVITDFIQMYKGRIEDALYKDKLDEIYKAFNNRSVKIV